MHTLKTSSQPIIHKIDFKHVKSNFWDIAIHLAEQVKIFTGETLLKKNIPIYLSEETTQLLEEKLLAYKNPIQAWLKWHIVDILNELIENAYDACLEKYWDNKDQYDISVQIWIQENILTIQVKDNGVWKNSLLKPWEKWSSVQQYRWRYWIWEISIQEKHFVTKYQRYFHTDGASIELEIDLDRLQDFNNKVDILNIFS